jgi:short-subunit dehydrogenase
MAIVLAQVGADIALVSRTESELQKVKDEIILSSPDRSVFLIPADLTRFSEIPAVVEKIVARYGRIDIVINNAGRNIRKPPEKILPEDWGPKKDLESAESKKILLA